MAYRRAQVDGLKDVIAKVRKAVHKLAPRELSPTRMIEKWAADKKKAGQAKVAKVADESAAKNAAADEMLAQQIAVLNTALPVAAPTEFATQPAQVYKAPAKDDYPTEYVVAIVAGVAGLGLLAYLLSRK